MSACAGPNLKLFTPSREPWAELYNPKGKLNDVSKPFRMYFKRYSRLLGARWALLYLLLGTTLLSVITGTGGQRVPRPV